MHALATDLRSVGIASAMRLPVAVLIAVAGATLSARTLPDAQRSAGDFTIEQFDAGAFAEPAPVLSYPQSKTFKRGRAHFNRKWVQFPSLGGDWGLGPTFIADRCSACHVGAGRGSVPASPDEQLFSMLVRVSLPGTDERGRPKPLPNYGAQLQNQGLMGQDTHGTFLGERVRPEAEVYVDWETHTVAFADGEEVELRKPVLRVGEVFFGPLGDDVQTSLRIAQPLLGLGLLEAIPESTLLDIAERQAAAGLNGRPNYVWDDIGERRALGRFGWKANEPSIAQQIAAAFADDLGVTSSLYGEMNCPGTQTDCAAQPPGNQPELIDLDWQQLVFWTRALAVPARRNVEHPEFARGAALFTGSGCASCHVAELRTADEFPEFPNLAGQRIRAYTDLLLHDMGEGLADGRPDFEAGPRDWRTPPLWGLGLIGTVTGDIALLHDGRARSVSEAILWHGGEAEAAREAFRTMPKPAREALLFYLDSI